MSFNNIIERILAIRKNKEQKISSKSNFLSQRNFDKITKEPVINIENDGGIIVGGSVLGKRLYIIGHSTVQLGELVYVAWKGSDPIGILKHTWQKAQFALTFGSKINPLVEELLIKGPDQDDSRIVIFRNYDQLTELPEVVVPSGGNNARFIKWGFDRDHFIVGTTGFGFDLNIYKFNRFDSSKPFNKGDVPSPELEESLVIIPASSPFGNLNVNTGTHVFNVPLTYFFQANIIFKIGDSENQKVDYHINTGTGPLPPGWGLLYQITGTPISTEIDPNGRLIVNVEIIFQSPSTVITRYNWIVDRNTDHVIFVTAPSSFVSGSITLLYSPSSTINYSTIFGFTASQVIVFAILSMNASIVSIHRLIVLSQNAPFPHSFTSHAAALVDADTNNVITLINGPPASVNISFVAWNHSRILWADISNNIKLTSFNPQFTIDVGSVDPSLLKREIVLMNPDFCYSKKEENRFFVDGLVGELNEITFNVSNIEEDDEMENFKELSDLSDDILELEELFVGEGIISSSFQFINDQESLEPIDKFIEET